MNIKNYNLKFCAKGSRKIGDDFIKETKFLANFVGCIEIDFNYPHDTNFKKELSFLKKIKEDKNIQYTVHAQYLSGSINDFNEKIRKESIKQVYNAIDNAHQLGASTVTLHPALEPYGLKLEKRKEFEIDAYIKIAAYALKKNIKIGLENEAQTCFWFPDRACKFELINETVSRVDSKNFGMTLDVGHANVSGENYVATIKKYGDKIYHIHAHDNLGKPENNLAQCKRPDPHLTPGNGTIDWKKVIDALKEINYGEYFEIECEVKEIQNAIEYIKSLL